MPEAGLLRILTLKWSSIWGGTVHGAPKPPSRQPLNPCSEDLLGRPRNIFQAAAHKIEAENYQNQQIVRYLNP